jgi:hypothetical protein
VTRRRLAIVGLAAASMLAVAVPLALAGTSLTRGSLSTGDTQQTDRLFRDGVPSTCTSIKAFPGLFGDQSTQSADAYGFWNATNQFQCVTVTLQHQCGPADVDNINAFAAAYDDSSYDPTNPGAGWIGDAGQSGSPERFGIVVAPFQTFEVVVSTVEDAVVQPPPEVGPEQVPAGTGCVSYTLTVRIGKTARTINVKTAKPKWKWSAYDHR